MAITVQKATRISKAKTGVVNVATVPQRSLFRYPGGKTWLVPYIRQWLTRRKPVDHLIEPFAGGGIVSLTAVCEDLAKRATLVEKDSHVAAVWRILLNGGAHRLADRIANFEISLENVKSVLTAPGDYSEEICALARRFQFQAKLIPMKSTHHECKHELLIGKDLGWLSGLHEQSVLF